MMKPKAIGLTMSMKRRLCQPGKRGICDTWTPCLSKSTYPDRRARPPERAPDVYRRHPEMPDASKPQNPHPPWKLSTPWFFNLSPPGLDLFSVVLAADQCCCQRCRSLCCSRTSHRIELVVVYQNRLRLLWCRRISWACCDVGE